MSLAVKNLGFAYGQRTVLRDISFAAEKGEFVSVLGPNGVGKSTLFRLLLGLLAPKEGEILIEGRPIAGYSMRELARQIAYIPQSHNPVFNYTVFDMVLMGTSAAMGVLSSPSKAEKQRAEQALGQLSITHLAGRGYAHISGGERQLVLVARAIAQSAKILVMDEPSASLDFGNRLHLMQTARSLAGEGYTIVQSTHDPDQAYQYSDRILALKDGCVLGFDRPQSILKDELVSGLYDTPIAVHSLKDDRVRICLSRAAD